MIKLSRLKLALLTGAAFFSTQSFAQEDAGLLVRAGAENATLLTKAYLEPLFKGFGNTLNSNWNNTAKTKKTGRFDLRIGASIAIVPTKDKTFDVNSLGLTNTVRVKSGSSSISPTVSGANTSNTPIMEIYSANAGPNDKPINEFKMPSGSDIGIVPGALLQASVGLPKGIEISARGIPEVTTSNYGTFSMLGGGIKIDPLKLLGPKIVGKVVPFDIALAVGYSQFNYDLDLDYKFPDNDAQNPNNQKIDVKFKGINAEAILSKKLLAFTPFLSLGYNTANASGGLLGDYKVASGYAGVYPLGTTTYSTVSNPVNIDQKYVNNYKATAGFQLNLAFFRFFAAYSLSEYQTASAGIGFGFGN